MRQSENMLKVLGETLKGSQGHMLDLLMSFELIKTLIATPNRAFQKKIGLPKTH